MILHRRRSALDYVDFERWSEEPAWSIGRLTGAIRDSEPVRRAQTLGRAADTIGAVVDDEFRAHCTLGGLEGGVLSVLVAEPGRLAGIRWRWQEVLREQLIYHRAGLSVRDVRFSVGTGGLPIEAG